MFLMNEAIDILRTSKAEFFLGPRPGKKSFQRLKELRLTHCCTLLSEREDAALIAKFCKKLRVEGQVCGEEKVCEWVWLPIEGGNLEILRQSDIASLIQSLTEAIKDEPNPRVYFHCSAGIHRTGFFVYILLRLQGHEPEKAESELRLLRGVTADQVGSERLELAEQIVSKLL
jgi:hypothetical protein